MHGLVDHIRSAGYREATESFCAAVREEPKSARSYMKGAVGAAAPLVQVPSHMMIKPNGDVRSVNYDHTILGWRTAIAVAPAMPEDLTLLPSVQAIWYAPQGLNIWEQLTCEYPGHYAISQGCNYRVPAEDGSPTRFGGPSWNTPKSYFEGSSPIVSGSAAERLEGFTMAVAEGRREESYGLFLGLKDDLENRKELKQRLLFTGIIDLQDTLINRNPFQNLGHKALRARALVDIADYLGWENAGDVMLTVVPDLACNPRLYALWNEAGAVVRIELGGGGSIPKRALPLTEYELDGLASVLLNGGPADVNIELVHLYRAGHGILDVGDGIAVGYQRYLMNVVEHPSAISRPTHAFDYTNVVHTWIRNYDNPDQVRGPFMTARFVNDTIRENQLFPHDPRTELESRDKFRPWADGLTPGDILSRLTECILAQDAPRACALADSYLDRTSERKDLLQVIASAAFHFQNDPHIGRNCASSLEEYKYNQTSRRDDIIRGFVKHQSRYVKRTLEEDAFRIFATNFEKA